MLFSDETYPVFISIPKDIAHIQGTLCRVNQFCIFLCAHTYLIPTLCPVVMTTLLYIVIAFKRR